MPVIVPENGLNKEGQLTCVWLLWHRGFQGRSRHPPCPQELKSGRNTDKQGPNIPGEASQGRVAMI